MSMVPCGFFAQRGFTVMRKLAIASFSFSVAIFACNYIFPPETVLYASLVCALVGAAVLGVRLKSLRGLVIAAFAASIGFAVFSAHYDLTVKRAHQLAEQTRSISFELLGDPQVSKSYASAEARIDTEGLPRLKCLLYASPDALDGFAAGDLIAAEAKLSAADIRYGEKTGRYTARDIYLTASLKGEIEGLGHRHSLTSVAAAASAWIAGKAQSVFSEDTAPFLRALMIGDKSELYDDDALYVSLSRAGLMHVAAVSGMHVTYLVAFLQFLLGKGKRSTLICLPLVWAFVAISGMTPSAIRAAVMQTMLLSAPLFNRENDALTSLSAALGLLLLCNPFSAASVSLQLSFAAMLGVVLFAERIQETMLRSLGEGKMAKILRVPVGIISCTLSVMVFTLPISAAYFGYVALLSPLSNLLCLWAIPICFIGAFAACALSWIPLLGSLLVTAVSLLSRYILLVCRLISSFSFSAVYLPDRISALWIVLFYLAMAVCFLFRLKPHFKLIVPLAVGIFSLLLSHALFVRYYASARETVTAIDVGQGQCISVMSGQRAILVDCGSASYAEYNAGDCAAGYLKSCGIDRIDAVVFTHLHVDHANGFERLSNLIGIGKVIIPLNVDDSDELFFQIVSCAAKHEIEIEYISENETLSFGDIRIRLFAALSEGKGNEACMPLIVSVDDYDAVISGDAPASVERKLIEQTDLSGAELLVAGHHGSKSASCEEYLSAVSGDIAVVSVGKNSYGQPSPEVLERLAFFGYTVYRTDLAGNVEIRING